MKHPYFTDKKYIGGGIGLLLFIGAAYLSGYEHDYYLFAHIAAFVFSVVAITGYFAMKK